MKLMFASDIHGSQYYCEKMLKRYTEENCDKLILLGDLLYHGPRNDLPKEYNPKEVIKMLNNLKEEILCVRGNCEAEVDQMVLEFPVLADYMIMYIESRMLFITHGHKYNTANPPMLKNNDLLIHGHTHVQAIEEHSILGKNNVTCEKYTYINPGSVSIPKNGNECSYMIYENKTFTIKNLDGKDICTYSLA